MLSKISQARKDEYHVESEIQNKRTKQKQTHRIQEVNCWLLAEGGEGRQNRRRG